MGKMKQYILLIGLLTASPAFAVDPITMGFFLAEATGVVFTLAEVAAITFVANFAISSIVSRIFSKEPPKPVDNGVRQQVPPSSTNSLPIVYGDAYLGGAFVDAVLSTDQKKMWYVLAISHISPDGLFTFDKTKFYYGDRLITFDTTEPAKVISLTDGAGNVDDKINDNLYIYLYRSDAAGVITNLDTGGTSPGSGNPDTIMSVAAGVPSGLEWPASGRQMNGLAFAVVKLLYSQEDDAVQLQQLTFKCSHTLNGTGVAKPGDVWLDYLKSPIYGGAIDATLVNTTSATDLNTYSDQLITFTDNQGNPATQPRYRINGVLDTGQTVLSNVDQVLMAADSWMSYNAPSGQWSIVINKAEGSSYAFNDTNIIGDIKVGTVDINQAINQIEAKFPSKLNKDIPDYVFIETPSGLLYPNEPVNKYSITLELVNDSVQAQYLCNRMLEQAREDLIVNINTTYVGIQINAGDIVSITNTAYGWSGKLFRVMKVNEASLPDGGLGALLELNEYNAQVYDDKPITEFQPSPNTDIPSPQFFSALTAPTVTASRPAASIPSFDVQVNIPATGRVTFITLFYTTSSSPTAADWFVLDRGTLANGAAFNNSTTYTFLNEFLPAGTYYFGYLVGNPQGQTAISVKSAALVWNPVGMSGVSGFSGYSGYSGLSGTGGTGPRNATGFVYYELASPTAPSAPSLSSYNFSTGAFGSISANWTTTFTPPNPVTNPATQAGSKFWAVRYYVTEATFGGVQTITVSGVFNWQNLDGLVTFTNVTTNSGTTFIDGGNIIANSITSTKINVTNLIVENLQTSTSGQRVEITKANNDLRVYNTSGTLVAQIGGTGLGAIVKATGTTLTGPGVWGVNSGAAPGVYGQSSSGEGVYGISTSGYGVYGISSSNESIRGYASTAGGTNHGVRGLNANGAGSGSNTAGLVGAANGFDFYADGAGTNYGPFTGTHDALTEPTDTFEIGDIVIDQQVIAKNGISSTITLVKSSTVANQAGALGVVCALPHPFDNNIPAVYMAGFNEQTGAPIPTPQYDIDKNLYNLMAVNSVGEGQINVCGENGDIATGDLIVTSSTPGKGMKQADDIVRSITVAKAREAATFSSPTEVKVIACIYLSG